METTVLLAQLFGFYSVIGGVVVLARRSYFMPVIGAFVEEKLTRLVIGMLELLGGLLVVLTHNDFSTGPAAVISIFGWALLLEGIFYMAAPDKVVSGLVKGFNQAWWYTVGGIVGIALGLYLLNSVFAWV